LETVGGVMFVSRQQRNAIFIDYLEVVSRTDQEIGTNADALNLSINRYISPTTPNSNHSTDLNIYRVRHTRLLYIKNRVTLQSSWKHDILVRLSNYIQTFLILKCQYKQLKAVLCRYSKG